MEAGWLAHRRIRTATAVEDHDAFEDDVVGDTAMALGIETHDSAGRAEPRTAMARLGGTWTAQWEVPLAASTSLLRCKGTSP